MLLFGNLPTYLFFEHGLSKLLNEPHKTQPQSYVHPPALLLHHEQPFSAQTISLPRSLGTCPREKELTGEQEPLGRFPLPRTRAGQAAALGTGDSWPGSACRAGEVGNRGCPVPSKRGAGVFQRLSK